MQRIVVGAAEVSEENPFPVEMIGEGGGGGAVTVADGADVAEGAVADAAVAAGAAGTVSAKLRRVTTQLGALTDGTQKTQIPEVTDGHYETVAASQTAQVLGATGGVGDYLSGLLVIPATTSPGAVAVKDGNGSDITVFAGGATSVSNLVPFFIPLGAKTINATTPGWKVTTGANVSVVATGKFT
jgi:hypothetical protein